MTPSPDSPSGYAPGWACDRHAALRAGPICGVGYPNHERRPAGEDHLPAAIGVSGFVDHPADDGDDPKSDRSDVAHRRRTCPPHSAPRWSAPPAVPTPSRSSAYPSSSPGRARSGPDRRGGGQPPRDLGLAAGVFHRLGLVHQPDHTGLGWDFAGTVTATGPDVDLPLGAHVAGLVDGFDRDYGTYAEQLVVSASDTALVPDGLDLVTAATVPLNGLAAAQIADLLGDGAGRSLLVTGAAGAVGGYVVRLAQDRGWRVTGLARTEDETFVRAPRRRLHRRRHARLGRSGRRGPAPGTRRRTGPRRRPLRRRAAERGTGRGAQHHRPRGGDTARRCPARPAPRRHGARSPAGTGARRRTARPSRHRPPGRRQGRRARTVRRPALSSADPTTEETRNEIMSKQQRETIDQMLRHGALDLGSEVDEQRRLFAD